MTFLNINIKFQKLPSSLPVTATAIILSFLTAAVCALVKEKRSLLEPWLRPEIRPAAAAVVILTFSSSAAVSTAAVIVSAAAAIAAKAPARPAAVITISAAIAAKAKAAAVSAAQK